MKQLSNFFNLPQIDANLTVWLILDGKEYELSQFNVSFGQSVDFKGQPQDEIRGGRLLIGLTQTLPDSLYRWAMKSEPKDGVVVFRSQTANAPLRIEFMNAYCVNFMRNISNKGGVVSSLQISPDEIFINGISFDNHWA